MLRSKTHASFVLVWLLRVTCVSLDYSAKGLTEVPEEVLKATKLEMLDLKNNSLTQLPDQIGHLTQPKWLDVRCNQIEALPETIGSLSELKWLMLKHNQIATLPKKIKHLDQMQMLKVSNNKLNTHPEEMCRLTQLVGLDLSSNELIALTKKIGQLTHLQGLNLSYNLLTSLPEETIGLEQLLVLDLSNNQLTFLPHTIVGLQRLILLDLQDNPLVERGEGDTFGWRDLRERFGNRVVLSQNALHGPVAEIKEDDVYARHREDPLHWNIERLRHIRVDSVPPHTLSAHDLLDIWSGSLVKHALPVAEGRDMASYIQTLYGIDKDAFRGWHMYTESLAATQDLVEAVLLRLRDSPSDAQVYVPEYARRCGGVPTGR